MAIDNFIPEVWASKVLDYQDKALVFGNIVNTDYEGDISAMGDTVHINQLGDITVSDYTKNADLAGAEALTDTTQALVIDQAKAINFQIDDVDKAQQTPKLMNHAMERAAYALAEAKDAFIAGLYTGVDASMIVGLGNDTTPLVLTPANIYETITQAGLLLDEADVPTVGRWAVIAPWMKKMLLDSTEFTSASKLGDEIKVNGMIGQIAGFTIYVSNNVVNTAATKYKVMFGTNEAITLATQLQEVVAYKPEGRFADAIKSLDLYGGKLVQSKGIALGTFNKA